MKLLKGLFLLFPVVLSFGSSNAASVKSEGRIVGGFEIPLSEAPYQVSILYMQSHVCGGNYISKFIESSGSQNNLFPMLKKVQ